MPAYLRYALLLVVLGSLASALGVVACGGEEGKGSGVAEEGEAVEVGGLAITVDSTRYLYPSDERDAAYLTSWSSAGEGLAWLGVFLDVTNEGDKAAGMPSMAIRDPAGEEHAAFPSEYPTAIRFGERIAPGEQLPRRGASKEEDPEGALVIFRVATDPKEYPLILEIGNSGPRKTEVKLDVSATSAG